MTASNVPELVCLVGGHICLPEDQAKLLIDTMTVFSVISAAGFGLLGLFTDYKGDDNKVTLWGRLAAAGIVASALISILLSTLHDRLQANSDRRNAVAAALLQATDSDRFNTQLGKLATVEGGLGSVLKDSETVRGQLGRSIASQQRQLAAANGVARDLETGNRAARDDADRLLRRVYASAEQVSARDVKARVAVACEYHHHYYETKLEPPADPPPAFAPHAEIRVAAFAPAGNLTPVPLVMQPTRAANACWSSVAGRCQRTPLWSGTSETHAQRRAPRVSRENHRADAFFAYVEASGFDDFTSSDATLTRRSDWNGVELQVQIVVPDAPFLGLFTPEDFRLAGTGSIFSGTAGTFEDVFLGEKSSVVLDGDDAVLPCFATADILLGDRVVASGRGELAKEGRNLVLLLPPLTVPPNTFPAYAPTPPSPSPEHRRGSPSPPRN